MIDKPLTVTVPCVGCDVIAMELTTPVIELARLITVAVPNVTVAALAVATGAAGNPTCRLTVAGSEVPPMPVAVNEKLSGPK